MDFQNIGHHLPPGRESVSNYWTDLISTNTYFFRYFSLTSLNLSMLAEHHQVAAGRTAVL